MPYLSVKIATFVPAAEFGAMATTLALELSALTTQWLGKKHDLTAVTVERVEPMHWFVAGKPLVAHGVASFFHEVKVTAGTNTKDEKAAYLRAVYDLFGRVLGIVHPASYAVIQEVPADAWGYSGETQERRYVRATGM